LRRFKFTLEPLLDLNTRTHRKRPVIHLKNQPSCAYYGDEMEEKPDGMNRLIMYA
jgi:hypothetical protein